jgi:hypothetical protein
MRYSLALKPNEVLSGTPLPSPFLLDGHVIEMATIARARERLATQYPHHIAEIARLLELVVLHVRERGCERGHAPGGVQARTRAWAGRCARSCDAVLRRVQGREVPLLRGHNRAALVPADVLPGCSSCCPSRPG